MILQGKGRAYRNALRKFIDKLYTKVSNFVNVFSRENAILSLFFRNFSSFSTQKEMEAGAPTEARSYCENQMFRAYFNALGAEKAAEAKAQLGQLCPVGFLLGGKRRKIPKKQG